MKGNQITSYFLCLLVTTHGLISPIRQITFDLFGLRQRVSLASSKHSRCHSTKCSTSARRYTCAIRIRTDLQSKINDDISDDDDDLLKTVKLEMLKGIAKQQGLPTNGSKKHILERLRAFAEEQAASNTDDEFYFTTPDSMHVTKQEASMTNNTSSSTELPKNMPLSSDAYVNEDGERIVTVFSTKEEADLTKVGPHTRPGGMDAAAASFADATGHDSNGGLSAADTIRSTDSMEQNEIFSKVSKQEIEEAKKQCRELMDILLDGTAPGFSDPSDNLMNVFTTFDPSSIDNTILEKYSASIRMNKGQILNEVVREVEIEAVGHDGMAGDNVEKGGGHYRQVQRVGPFLKGYLNAESRKVARETTSFLLNTVAAEGAQGLDFAFATMSRGDGDGELNDDLIEYLEEAVTSQKRIVIKQTASLRADTEMTKEIDENLSDENNVVGNLPVDDFDIETIDMNDPKTRENLVAMGNEAQSNKTQERELMPSEKLLLLLHSLLERVKAEAAFRADEHGKNLRLMALCLNTKNDSQRFQVIQREIGSSLTTADEFAEFLDSAIQYAESSSTEVAPGTKKLDVNKLRKIQREVADVQSIQAVKASGLKSSASKWGNEDSAFQ